MSARLRLRAIREAALTVPCDSPPACGHPAVPPWAGGKRFPEFFDRLRFLPTASLLRKFVPELMKPSVRPNGGANTRPRFVHI